MIAVGIMTINEALFVLIATILLVGGGFLICGGEDEADE